MTGASPLTTIGAWSPTTTPTSSTCAAICICSGRSPRRWCGRATRAWTPSRRWRTASGTATSTPRPSAITTAVNYQQIYEAGEPFEELIDHPAWFDKVRCFVGSEDSFDEQHGPLLIDEAFANVRTAGQSIGVHNGGHLGLSRCQFRYYAGRFHCNQINVLVALTDIGPGDGGTVLIPGSHKSNFEHPSFERFCMGERRPDAALIEGAVEVHMRAGDALLFVDCCTHGSARRRNAGERRVVVYRYGPSWGRLRHAYQPSPELLARLTPHRRSIVAPASERRLAPDPQPAAQRQQVAT